MRISFVFDYCEGGDLLKVVINSGAIPEALAKKYFRQLIEGLQYLHSRSIMHRDIKLENILFDGKGNLRICDLGNAKKIISNDEKHQVCGTPGYYAPEMFSEETYSFEVDIWASGITLYAMLFAQRPILAKTMAKNKEELATSEIDFYPTDTVEISELARDLLKQLLERDPKKRIYISDILGHPWLLDVTPIEDGELPEFDMASALFEEGVLCVVS